MNRTELPDFYRNSVTVGTHTDRRRIDEDIEGRSHQFRIADHRKSTSFPRMPADKDNRSAKIHHSLADRVAGTSGAKYGGLSGKRYMIAFHHLPETGHIRVMAGKTAVVVDDTVHCADRPCGGIEFIEIRDHLLFPGNRDVYGLEVSLFEKLLQCFFRFNRMKLIVDAVMKAGMNCRRYGMAQRISDQSIFHIILPSATGGHAHLRACQRA